MRSRAARLSFSATAWIGVAAAAAFLVVTEQDISAGRDGADAFRRHARSAAHALAGAQAGQQAYVAAGQEAASWMSRVATQIQEASQAVDALRAIATTSSGGQALINASSALTEFTNIDKRVRGYLRSGEPLMASDVVFSEGQENTAQAFAHVEAAREDEEHMYLAAETGLRLRQAYALAAAAGWAMLVIGILVVGATRPEQQPSDADAPTVAGTDGQRGDLPLHPGGLLGLAESSRATAPQTAATAPAETVATLAGIAELCTELSQVRDAADLQAFLGRAARHLDASGVVIWVGSSSGSDLQPIASHGYGERVLALMKPIPRSADNATSAAYRDGLPHVVPARPGASPGAVVAPLLSTDGCIGALTAEIRNGGEASAAVQSMAAIVAAQLASVLLPAASAASTPHSRVAS